MNGSLVALTAVAALGIGTSLHAQTVEWMRAPVLMPRRGHGAVYDVARERMIVFGGDLRFRHLYDQTWEYDGQSWIERDSTRGPTARSATAMAYDISRQRVVLFGGDTLLASGQRLHFSDTWEWDGDNWTEIKPRTRPGQRYDHAMAYDAARKRVVMYGGWDVVNRRNLTDTWEFDGKDWQQRSLSQRPSFASPQSMTYDAARKRIVMFVPSRTPSTWEYDGTKWTQHTPSVTPSSRSQSALCYDGARKRCVLFGGFPAFADTWEWDGSAWTQRRPQTSPPPGGGHSLVYDARRQRVVLFGRGSRTHEPHSDTWEWDGNNWTRAHAEPTPRGKAAPSIVYDSGRQRVVHFGGLDDAGKPLSTTTEWDGARWRQIATKTNPPPRWHAALAYDEARKRVVIFSGGATGVADTWEYDGTDWMQRTPAVSPPAGISYALAYDAARRHCVLFGPAGRTGTATWTWDGASWVDRKPSVLPATRSGHALAYDPVRQRVVLFGGYGGKDLDDTWEWDGSKWTESKPATRPPGRNHHAMAFDASRRVMVMYGGWTGDGRTQFGDSWEWDGTNWKQQQTKNAPGSFRANMAYDVARGRMVMYGAGGLKETWISGPLQPAVASPFGTACAGSNGLPLITSARPVAGTLGFGLEVLRARAMAPCAFGLSAGTRSLQLGSCTLYVADPIVLFPTLTNASGVGRVPLPIPVLPALRGVTAFAQAFVLDPSSMPVGYAFSAGRRLVIGD